MTLTPTERKAADRPRLLLDETALFEDLGLGQLAARSRAVAGDVLELVASLDAVAGAAVR